MPIRPQFDEYDDEKVLKAYLRKNYKRAFMTEEEMETLKSLPYDSEKGDRIHERIMERMLNNLDKVNVNRCPECDRVLETPRARQCLWCKHQWHDKSRPESQVRTWIELGVEEKEGDPTRVQQIRVRSEFVDEND